MNVTCHNCKTKLNIPDHKISSDKDSIFKCPKCKEKIQVPAVKEPKAVTKDKKQSVLRSFDERLNVLVCIDGDDLKKRYFRLLNTWD